MPQFILDHGSPEATKQLGYLDSFTQGYVEAMFFTSTGTGDDGDLEHATAAELAPETWERIAADCTAFQGAAATLLDAAYEGDYTAEQAGRDFWFTRNGHGAGFWDRGLPEDLGDKLSDLCRHKECDLYRGDDGRLYL